MVGIENPKTARAYRVKLPHLTRPPRVTIHTSNSEQPTSYHGFTAPAGADTPRNSLHMRNGARDHHTTTAPRGPRIARRMCAPLRPSIHPLPHLAHRVPWYAPPLVCCAGHSPDPRSWCAPTAYWCERPALFSAIADAKTEQERSIAVLKWFIVSLLRISATTPGLLSAAEHAQGPVHVP